MTAARRIAVATGSRAEFGLLSPVMRAIDDHPDLDLRVLVAGAHLLPPELTVREVAAAFDVAARIPMQEPGTTSRGCDAEALGRGVSGFAAWLQEHPVEVVVVLGDRIEAFAAAAAASVAGVRVAHLHGGDRAPGIADEAIRHAITGLAHIHLPATEQSAGRIVAMGELPARVHVVGSPALDGLTGIAPLADKAYDALGAPEIVVLQHPLGRSPAREQAVAACVLDACRRAGRVLAMHPTTTPGGRASWRLSVRRGSANAVTFRGPTSSACFDAPRCLSATAAPGSSSVRHWGSPPSMSAHGRRVVSDRITSWTCPNPLPITARSSRRRS